MAVFTPGCLPACRELRNEGIDIESPVYGGRPLHIALVNLMPLKEMTETDFLRLLSSCSTDIRLTLVAPATHRSKNTAAGHIDAHYITPRQILDLMPDGVIITGAPVEKLDFEQVDYWPELTQMFDQLAERRVPSLYICWGALAGMYHLHSIPKRQYSAKISGVYPHRAAGSPDRLLRGMDDTFYVPHSRYCGVDVADVERCSGLAVVATGAGSGLYIAAATELPNYYVTGHSEYAASTLDFEYHRDLDKGIDPAIPVNYYPDDDPSRKPEIRWRSHAHLLFSNWIGIVKASVNK